MRDEYYILDQTYKKKIWSDFIFIRITNLTVIQDTYQFKKRNWEILGRGFGGILVKDCGVIMGIGFGSILGRDFWSILGRDFGSILGIGFGSYF